MSRSPNSLSTRWHVKLSPYSEHHIIVSPPRYRYYDSTKESHWSVTVQQKCGATGTFEFPTRSLAREFAQHVKSFNDVV